MYKTSTCSASRSSQWWRYSAGFLLSDPRLIDVAAHTARTRHTAGLASVHRLYVLTDVSGPPECFDAVRAWKMHIRLCSCFNFSLKVTLRPRRIFTGLNPHSTWLPILGSPCGPWLVPALVRREIRRTTETLSAGIAAVFHHDHAAASVLG